MKGMGIMDLDKLKTDLKEQKRNDFKNLH